MKTPQQWLETVDFDWDEQVSVRMIEAIQQDAFESGRVAAYKDAANAVRACSPNRSRMMCLADDLERTTPTPPDNQKGGS